METDKIPQEIPMAQAPLENEPIHKSFLNQKGNFLLILGLVVLILVVLGAGGYFLTMNKNSNSNQYIFQSSPSSNPVVVSQTPSNSTVKKSYSPFVKNGEVWIKDAPSEVQLTNTNGMVNNKVLKLANSGNIYYLVNKKVPVVGEQAIKNIYQRQNGSLTMDTPAEIRRINPVTKKDERIIEPLPDRDLGVISLPSGCCLEDNAIQDFAVSDDESFIIFARRDFWKKDLISNNLSVKLFTTDNKQRFAYKVLISSNGRLLFLERTNFHGYELQEILDQQARKIYEFYNDSLMGVEETREFDGFISDQSFRVKVTKYDNLGGEIDKKDEIINLTTLKSTTF